MRILLVSLDNSKNAVIGGKNIHQELIKNGWRLSGHQVEIIYPNGARWYLRRGFRKLMRLAGCVSMLQYVRRSHDADMLVIRKLVAAQLRESTVDIISAQDVLAAVAVRQALGKLSKTPPVVLTLHGYFARESVNYGQFSGENERQVMEYCMGIEKEALAFVSAVITVDSRIRHYVMETFHFTKPCLVIANAIDDTRFFPISASEKDATRRSLKLKVDETIIIVARRLVNKNGVRFAVEAMQRLQQSGDLQKYRTKMLVIGNGPEEKDITDYITQNHLERWVKMVGVVPHAEIDAFYKISDIVLMPSITSNGVEEATSLSMLEGLACGKLVIASAIGGLKEVIVDEENGLLVAQKDPDALAASLRTVFIGNASLEKIRQNAASYAKSNSGYREHSSKFISFFRSLLTR